MFIDDQIGSGLDYTIFKIIFYFLSLIIPPTLVLASNERSDIFVLFMRLGNGPRKS